MNGITNTGGLRILETLSLSVNGIIKVNYDGTIEKTLDITLASLGAAAATHTHAYLPLTGGMITGNLNIRTTPNLDWEQNPAALTFSNPENAQAVYLKYSHLDSYAYPAGLTLCGDQGREYLAVDGPVISNMGPFIVRTPWLLNESDRPGLQAIMMVSNRRNPTLNSSAEQTTVISTWGTTKYGASLVFGGDAATVITSGESYRELIKNIGYNTEDIFLISDYGIEFYTGGDNPVNLKKAAEFTSAGQFITYNTMRSTGYYVNDQLTTPTIRSAQAPSIDAIWIS